MTEQTGVRSAARTELPFGGRYKTVKTAGGFRFLFFCEICGRAVESPEFSVASFFEALERAKAVVRRYFNRCHRCGRWVCDEHYNEDEMQCVLCAPQGAVCPVCGARGAQDDCFCRSCGGAL